MPDDTKATPADPAKKQQSGLEELLNKAIALSKDENVQQLLKQIPGFTSGEKDLSPADQQMLDDLDKQIKAHRDNEQKLLKQIEENAAHIKGNDELLAKSKAVVAQLGKEIADIEGQIKTIEDSRAPLRVKEAELDKEIADLKAKQAEQHKTSEQAVTDVLSDIENSSKK